MLGIVANECRLKYINNTSPYVINMREPFHRNLKSFEGQILKNFEDGNRNQALLALVQLESQFETVEDSEKTLDDKFKLDALIELITKSGPSGYEKLLFLKIWEHGINDETKEFCNRLKKFYSRNRINSIARAIFEHWIQNWGKVFDCVYEGNRVYIHNLTEKTFLSYFDKFLHGLETDEPDPNPEKALKRVTYQFQIMTQFWNFYKDHKQHFFFGGKLFESYMLNASKRIFSMHQRIINGEHPEDLEVAVD